MEKWYAIMSKPRQERNASSMLQMRGIPIYVPEVNECMVVERKQQVVRVGLFPGYFFAKFDYDLQRRMVIYCRGVRGIVSFGAVPAEVQPGLLDEIRARLQEQDTFSVSRLKRGDVLQFTNGPLIGVKAIFDYSMTRSGKERVVVLLRTLFHQSRVVVPLSHVEVGQVAV